MHACMKGWINKCMDEWRNEWRNEWINPRMNAVNEWNGMEWNEMKWMHEWMSNLQLQTRIARLSQHHSYFTASSGVNAVCHSRLQTRIAGASQQIDQISRSINSADSTMQNRLLRFSTFWSAHSALATVWHTFCRQLSHIDLRGHRHPTSTTLLLLMLLTWWWHDDDEDEDDDDDDKTAPGHSSVTRKFSK